MSSSTTQSPLPPSPSSALLDILSGNDLFVAARDPGQFAVYEKSQHPSVTMLTCCDSRLHQLVFNFDPIDRTFVIQNIGNQLQPAAGSVDYGIQHLKTPLLLVLGHTRCGAINAAMGDYSGLSWEIIRELNGLHLPLRKCAAVSRNDDPEQAWLRAVECNVDYQVDLALRRYSEEVKAGRLAIAGCVYDFADLYKRGCGRILLINLNGLTAASEMAASPILSLLDGELKNVAIYERAQ